MQLCKLSAIFSLLFALILNSFVFGDTSVELQVLSSLCNEAVHEYISDVKDGNSSIINCCTVLWVGDCLQKKCQQAESLLVECKNASMNNLITQTAKKNCNNLNLKEVNYAYCIALPEKSSLWIIVTSVIAIVLLLVLVTVMVCIFMKIKIRNSNQSKEMNTKKKKVGKSVEQKYQGSKQTVSASVGPTAVSGAGGSSIVSGAAFSGYSTSATSANPGGASRAGSVSKDASSSMAGSSSVAPGSVSLVKNGRPIQSSTFSGAKPNERPVHLVKKEIKCQMGSNEKQSAKPSISVIVAGCKL